MRIRPLQILLLAGIVFWASGAAQFLHEFFEHGDHQGHALLHGTHSSDHHKSSPPNKPPGDDDDCPTCQMLAHMSASPVVPDAIVILHLPAPTEVPVADVRVPAQSSLSSAPIRGPPQV